MDKRKDLGRIIKMNSSRKESLWTRGFIFGTTINFLIMVNYYALMVVVTDYAMSTYAASPAIAGLAASSFIIGSLVARFVAGGAMDRMGRKRLLIIGVVCEVVLSLLYLPEAGLASLFIIRILHGASYGICSNTVGTMVTALVPNARKGEGVGYYMLSVTLGAAIGPFLGIFLTQSFGFTLLFSVVAAVALLALAASLPLKVTEACSLKPSLAPSVSDTQKYAAMKTVQDSQKTLASALHLRNYVEFSVISIGVVCALLYFCYSSLLAFLTPFAAQSGLETAASFFFVMYALATFITRPFTGKLFDHKGDRAVMVPAFISFIIGMVLLGGVHTPATMFIAAALLGFGVGTVQASGLALAVRLADDERLSLANSTFYILLDVGVGIGPLLLGLVEPMWGYRGLFEAMAIMTILILALYCYISRKKGRLKARLSHAGSR